MLKTYSGACSCGAVQYIMQDEPLFIQACHCTDCQRLAGSAFVLNMWMEASKVEITGEDKLSSGELATGSGKGKKVFFCGNCGTQMWNEYLAAPKGLLFIRVSTLHDAKDLKPMAHIYTTSKQAWVNLPKGIPCFEEFYDLPKVWPGSSLQRLSVLMEGT